MIDLPRHFAERVEEFEKECARLKRNGRGKEGVVFLGDSLVEYYKGPIPWVNRGICSDHLYWPDINLFERLGSGRLHPNPRAIITLVGINDLNDEPANIARHVTWYRYLLTNLAQLYPQARLAACSLLPTRADSSQLNAGVEQINRELADLTAALGVAFLDVHPRFLDLKTRAARKDLVVDDGVHLTKRGYAELTAFFLEHADDLDLSSHGQVASGSAWPPFVTKASSVWKRLRPSTESPDGISAGVDREALAGAIAAAYGKGAWSRGADEEPDDALVRALILPEIDFLCRYADTGAPMFRDLYLGSRASFFAKNKALWAEAPEGLRGASDRDRALWKGAIERSPGGAAVWARLEPTFAELRQLVPSSPPKSIRLLFVGDCLLEDVELLLNGQLLRHGLLAKVDFILSKSPLEQARLVREFKSEKFHGVVYSPLSWEFDPEFRNFLEPTLRRPKAYRQDVEAVWTRVASGIRLLADNFECPVYVHNTAGVVRASDEVRRSVKALLTFPQRDYARKELSRRIGGLLQEINAKSYQHLVLIDELAAVRDLHDDLTLGRVLYYADAIHPAALSCEVAARLASYVVAAATLVDKKVVVCDLDNTLWDGVIGEGLGVRHQIQRQKTLQRLKEKGVVLAINSKNDPANVRWENSVLNASDFVASEISWGPKAGGMKRLQDTLNLKLKDFVFIDDRADERAMISQEFPQLTAIDPCLEETWDLFDAWAQLLGNDEGDRTKLYRERAEREKVIGDQVDTQAAADLFMKLQLKIDIRRAGQDDLKRVHELINRTNQWNLQGSRCTFAEVQAWHQSPRHLIYTARVSDKFGDMGLICCAVAEFGDTHLDIPVFVLSCRVFGYGVETLVLEQIKKDAATRLKSPKVKGRFVENAHNKPCKTMYEAHGFVLEEGVWTYPGGNVSAPDPVWFQRA